MKKALILFTAILLFGCSSDDDKNNYSFRNNTEFNVIVSPYENLLDGEPYFEFPIAPGETKTYKSEYMYGMFKISSNETSKNFDYKHNGNTRDIYSFNYRVKYSITGSAQSVNATYNTSSGSTGQNTYTLPKNIAYWEFNDDFVYISAQNNTGNGNVKVEIYFEDKLIKTDYCGGAYCVATASGSIY